MHNSDIHAQVSTRFRSGVWGLEKKILTVINTKRLKEAKVEATVAGILLQWNKLQRRFGHGE
jgi:hypothetical protein